MSGISIRTKVFLLFAVASLLTVMPALVLIGRAVEEIVTAVGEEGDRRRVVRAREARCQQRDFRRLGGRAGGRGLRRGQGGGRVAARRQRAAGDHLGPVGHGRALELAEGEEALEERFQPTGDRQPDSRTETQ